MSKILLFPLPKDYNGEFFQKLKKSFFFLYKSTLKRGTSKIFFGKYSWMSPLLSPILVLPYLFAVWCQ